MKTFLAAIAIVGAWSALPASSRAEPVQWNVDPSHSEVGFVARHLAFAKVRGELKTFSAQIVADDKTGKIEKLSAEADTASIDTGVKKRDDHLRSDDFFNAAKYPKLKLELKSIKWKGKKFDAVVALTIRDITKDVKLSGELLGIKTVNFGQGPHLRAAYEAEATINRKEFGLNFAGLAEGIAIVGDEVEIHLQLEMSAPIKS